MKRRPPSTEPRRNELEREIEAAESRLSSAAGDQSLCAIGRSGHSFPAVKFHEGEVAALVKIRARTIAGDSIEAALAAAGSDIDRFDRLARHSSDWEAYLAGGSEAIARLVSSIRVDPDHPPEDDV